ncbi:MAG: hypothetical protein K0Q79_1514 [Flavipsychrobacter sp.]|jgi:phage gp36-like protein|nr:hypothetical protein [Flavipsychrobacter sp.]
MAYLRKEDLYTVIYPEILEQITRRDDTIINRAIASGMQEVKSYLSRWDLVQLFGDDETEPVVADEWLKAITKDVAAWWIIKLGNPGINYEHIRTCYQDSINVLRQLQAGKMQPDGWPYKDTTEESAPDGNSVEWSSNPKRSTRF